MLVIIAAKVTSCHSISMSGKLFVNYAEEKRGQQER